MTDSWIKKIEEDLEKIFDQFLESTPYQKELLKKEIDHENFLALENRKKILNNAAREVREELIFIVEEVRKWSSRAEMAKSKKNKALTEKVENHINTLKKKGRAKWGDLKVLGIKSQKIENELKALSQNATLQHPSIEDKWTKFETEMELNQLKKTTEFQG